MSKLDLIVFVVYLIGLVAMGSVFSKMKDAKTMFNAGGQSPWWLSGLSAFMTTFSAGTFVVWGGLAYQHGLVGVSILMVIGVASLLVGWLVAGKWKSMGYESAASFLDARFGRSIVQFYTWIQGVVGLFTMGGAVYALAVVVTALIPMPDGHWLADAETGHFSVTAASLIICAVVILITTGGGLWAVLMTDALQFILLTVSVVMVVPMILMKVGGVKALIEKSPDGFWQPVSGEFSWYFLVGWCLVFFFKMGGEWAYIQRFSCVKTSKDARRSSYLFGILYLISPILWMIPPIAYQIIDPSVDPEKAYIYACELVLPSGMLGLMIAAMCSATASMVTTQLNVFAGAFTSEFYKRIFRPFAGDREQVVAGRIITVLLGGIAVAGALLIPIMGTYTGYILASVAMLTGPLVLPTIWGLYSKRIGIRTAWAVTLTGIFACLFVKIGLMEYNWLGGYGWTNDLIFLVRSNQRMTEIIVGLGVPVLILGLAEIIQKETDIGWVRVKGVEFEQVEVNRSVVPSPSPAKLCGWSTIIIGVLMVVITRFVEKDRVIVLWFSALLFFIGLLILWINKKLSDRSKIEDAESKFKEEEAAVYENN
ncbi:sodium:solute symporter family transporter [Echinicola shivajiensis]|uniref:sodium:solute symporter family transporter n=1 Tax=Echinicola shivajiensis TaxID=1035916 RepID=UPI001BFC217D|nr:hypothetical protein [Echinicola shivajiensis]